MKLPKLMTTADLSEYLKVPVRTIEGWRRRGFGPTHTRVGAQVRYSEDDVLSWLKSHKRRSSDPSISEQD